MLRHLSYCKTRNMLLSKNTLKFILNINFERNFAYSKVKVVDLLQINRNNMQCVTLSGTEGYKMPIIGLGTWKSTRDEVYNAVLTALNVGYRHIDTAFNYDNEEQIGEAISQWISENKGTRENLFITTKLPNFGNRPQHVRTFLEKSLKRLNLQYVDLYLIHMPFAFQLNNTATGASLAKDGTMEIDFKNDNVATWMEMERQVKSGLVRSIGLSNFNAKQVRKIYDSAKIKPSVLQVELHAHLLQKELLDACRQMNIAVTAYAPLGSPAAYNHFTSKYKVDMKVPSSLLTNHVVQGIAKKYNKTTGQILLRHLVEKNIIVIPKSSNTKRIEDNFKIFDFTLEHDDVVKLDNLDKKEDGRIFDFRFFKDIEKHPEYPF